MIPVAVGEHDRFNIREVDTQTGAVHLNRIVGGATIEHRGLRPIRSIRSDDQRQTVSRAAIRCRRRRADLPPQQTGQFARDNGRGGRQDVRHVVYQDHDLDPVGFNEAHVAFLQTLVMFTDIDQTFLGARRMRRP